MASTQADQLEALVLTLWRRRGEAASVAETTSQLQSMLTDPAALDAVEFYLPQFAHMLIQLGGASGDTWCRRSACAAGPPRCTLAAALRGLGRRLGGPGAAAADGWPDGTVDFFSASSHRFSRVLPGKILRKFPQIYGKNVRFEHHYSQI